MGEIDGFKYNEVTWSVYTDNYVCVCVVYTTGACHTGGVTQMSQANIVATINMHISKPQVK